MTRSELIVRLSDLLKMLKTQNSKGTIRTSLHEPSVTTLVELLEKYIERS